LPKSGSEITADRVLDTIADRFNILGAWPRAGRPRDELRPGYRSHAAGDYLIFYRIAPDDDVVIQRVIHGRRNLDAIFRNR
jgi:toxin ParE1/3/4